ncbi:MAG: copper amine oxidase N-terminal domain-containing protein [Anaerotignum sp.]
MKKVKQIIVVGVLLASMLPMNAYASGSKLVEAYGDEKPKVILDGNVFGGDDGMTAPFAMQDGEMYMANIDLGMILETSFMALEPTLTVEGKEIDGKVVEDGEFFWTYYPVKEFLETYGCTVTEDKANNTIYITRAYKEADKEVDNEADNEADNEIKVTVDGEKVDFAQKPASVDGRTLVPMRAIFEVMGADVKWDNTTRTVTSTKGDILVAMTIDNSVIHVNGNEVTLDVAPTIIDGATMVPARAVAEAFGADVTWDAGTKTVIIAQ